jgi:hypothetical protein
VCTSPSTAADLAIYSDSLNANWADWSWDTTTAFSNKTPTHTGTNAIAVTIKRRWGALYLHAKTPVDLTPYDQIRFWVHGGSTGNQKLELVVNGQTPFAFTAPASGWKLVSVPLSAFGHPTSLTDLYWSDASGGAQPTFYIDDIYLIQRPATPPTDKLIYGDDLKTPWSDWSWGSSRNFANTSAVHSGLNSLSVNITAAWGALFLHADSPIDSYGYSQLRFWVNGGTTGGQNLRVALNDFSQPFTFTAKANTWVQVTIPLSALGNHASIAEIYWGDAAGKTQPTFYLDDITLVAGNQTGPTLSVNAGLQRHAINADIYGMHLLDETLATELRLPLRRWGGNRSTRYNWQNDTTNTGNDWYFENIPNDNTDLAALPDGSASDRFVEQNRRTATRSLITVPTIGWVARRRTGGHPYDCGFKVSQYGAQQAVDAYDADCGNGLTTSGTAITGNSPYDTSMMVGPAYMTDWVTHLTRKYGTASNGGVAYYALDNEPMLWHKMHRDVHPEPAGYEEVRDRGLQYGAAIKAVDPDAKILGPVEWGWCAYFYSAIDGCSPGLDYAAHDNLPFVAWYLREMRNYQQTTAVRVLDYLDLHYYPAAKGVAVAPAYNAAMQALRLRSTRSLWDPSYKDESSLSTASNGGVAVQFIPRMKAWVADYYPGTKLAISEYNWGGLESINGALAQADVLGIFGREGLDLAVLWEPPTTTLPGAYAFRMFRNYDGAGSSFGETSVQSASADQGTLSIYAAQRTSDGALTVIVINKTTNDLNSTIAFSGISVGTNATIYRYSTANLSAIVREADLSIAAGKVTSSFPAQSLTLLVIPTSGTPESAVSNVSYPLQLAPGWNLLGNSLNQALSVTTLLGDPQVVNSVWKWNASSPTGWQFYSPQLDATALATYASSNGFGVLTTLNPGDGYWVNAVKSATLATQTGVPFNLTGANLKPGWNLMATGANVSPSALDATLNANTTLSTLWAWDSSTLTWYFFAPSLSRSGDLGNYISTMGYRDFSQFNMTLGNGAGFWVNMQ